MDSAIVPMVVTEGSTALMEARDPGAVIDKATVIANQLQGIIDKAKLYSMISSRKYVKVEGWTTMLSMIGIFPHVDYCRKMERDEEIVYESRVSLKTVDGRIVGSGEAICSSRERNWSNRDEFAIKSMAQTRATGKAARNGFSWIMALAGYEATPAEEMVGDEHQARSVDNPEPKPTVVKETGFKEGIFSLPEKRTGKNKKDYWVTIGPDTGRYFVFDAKVAEYLDDHAGKPISVAIESTDKGTRITGYLDESNNPA